VSILAGREVELDAHELDLLLAVPADRWVGEPPGVERLVAEGLLVREGDDVERQLAGWHLYAAAYHSLTRRSGLDLALRPELDEARLAEARETMRRRIDRGGPPPEAFPRRGGETVGLPAGEGEGALFDLLARRRTSRGFDVDAELPLGAFATVLRTVFGARGTATYDGGLEIVRKTSPSGGALHPIEAYPLVRRVEGLAPGLYHYAAAAHELELVEPLSGPHAGELLRRLTSGQGFFAGAQAAFLLTVRFRRNFWKYWAQREQYGVLLLDAGHLSQTHYLVATELGLGAYVTAVVDHEEAARRLGLGRFEEGLLALLGLGVPAPSALEPRFRSLSP
jgi:putative peptide maturation dehydrogenase